MSRLKALLTPLFIVAVILGLVYVIVWQWMICRVYIDPQEIMYVNSKIGEENPNSADNRVVDEGIKGIQKKIYGEGRHFINPIINECTVVRTGRLSCEISASQVGVVESRSGKNPEKGKFLVSSDLKNPQKGVIEEPLTPGIWRLNPNAYEIKLYDAVKIDAGFVGCIVSQYGTDPKEGRRLAIEGERGVMEKILQPGIYYINPRAFSVIKVDIGYRQTPFAKINFRSKDGFQISVEITVVWGILPEKVPYIIDQLGNVDDVSTKIILPQVQSLCRIEGSKYGAVELIEGDSREKFQNDFTQKLIEICQSKDISTQLGLVRNIDIPQDIRTPIQKSKIAFEEMNTKKELQKTQTSINQLEKLKQEVIKGVQEVQAMTDKQEATILAEGERQVAAIKAEQQVEVAKLERELAEIEANITRMLGDAAAQAKELKRRAEADKLVQEIHAIGGPEEYTLYNFANGLSDHLKIYVRHSGEGTLWTDLPASAKNLETMSALKILQEKEKKDSQSKK